MMESPQEMSEPKLRLEWVEAGSLSPNPSNWRRHPDGQMAALRGVIADPEIGWAGALLFNERTGRLIDGHARQKVVDPKALVPVLMGSWSEAGEKKILATLDPLAGMAIADIVQRFETFTGKKAELTGRDLAEEKAPVAADALESGS